MSRSTNAGRRAVAVSSALGPSSVTSLILWPHSNIATYCDSHHLLTPRNGRRKFLSPVQIPSMVLQCTSRTPSRASDSRGEKNNELPANGCSEGCLTNDRFQDYFTALQPLISAARQRLAR